MFYRILCLVWRTVELNSSKLAELLKRADRRYCFLVLFSNYRAKLKEAKQLDVQVLVDIELRRI